jgi:hypothetical protein
LLIRRNFAELKDGLIKDLLDALPERTKANPNGLYTYNRTDHIATFQNGSTIRFGHCINNSEKDLSHYLSTQYVFIGFDELGQFSYEAWAFASTRNRLNTACQPDARGRLPTPRMAGATNPTGPGWSWIRDLWGCHLPNQPVYEKRPVAALKLKEAFDINNPAHLERYNPAHYFQVYSNVFDNVAFQKRDPEYFRRLMALPPDLQAKHLYGDPDSKIGNYYSNFSMDRHVRNFDEVKWEPWQDRWMGSDWGLAHTWANYWMTRAKVRTLTAEGEPDKWRDIVAVYREFSEPEVPYGEMAKLVGNRTPPSEKDKLRYLFFSPERFSRSGIDDQHSMAIEWGDHLVQHGMPRPDRASNNREAGANFIFNMLETGDLVILDSCPKLIHAMLHLQRNPVRLEDVLKQDTQDDDCYDAFRYGLVSMLMEREKPEEVKEREYLASLEDPMTRFFMEYKLAAEKKKKANSGKPKFVPSWKSRLG